VIVHERTKPGFLVRPLLAVVRLESVTFGLHHKYRDYLYLSFHHPVPSQMVEEVDYESLPSNAGLAVNMLAGALAGISEHAVMFPIDSIKTRMQVFATSPLAVYSGVGNAFSRISSTEGLRALWRGVSSVILGAGPAHAVHFGTLEAVKELAGGNEAGNQWIATSLAGASATIASDAFMNPFDVIKQECSFTSLNSDQSGLVLVWFIGLKGSLPFMCHILRRWPFQYRSMPYNSQSMSK